MWVSLGVPHISQEELTGLGVGRNDDDLARDGVPVLVLRALAVVAGLALVDLAVDARSTTGTCGREGCAGDGVEGDVRVRDRDAGRALGGEERDGAAGWARVSELPAARYPARRTLR